MNSENRKIQIMRHILELEPYFRVTLIRDIEALYCLECGEGKITGTCPCDEYDEEDISESGSQVCDCNG